MKILKYRAGRWLAQKYLNYKASRYEKQRAEQHTESKEGVDMSGVSAVFEEMKNRFNSAAAAGLDAVFQYNIEDAEPYFVTIANGECAVAQGEHDEPSVTLTLDSQTLQEVMSGETDGMQAFMTGRIRGDGDIMLATRLTALFPVA